MQAAEIQQLNSQSRRVSHEKVKASIGKDEGSETWNGASGWAPPEAVRPESMHHAEPAQAGVVEFLLVSEATSLPLAETLGKLPWGPKRCAPSARDPAQPFLAATRHTASVPFQHAPGGQVHASSIESLTTERIARLC